MRSKQLLSLRKKTRLFTILFTERRFSTVFYFVSNIRNNYGAMRVLNVQISVFALQLACLPVRHAPTRRKPPSRTQRAVRAMICTHSRPPTSAAVSRHHYLSSIHSFGPALIRQLPVPLLPLSFTPNSITVILSTIDSLRTSQLSRLQQIQNSLARTVVKAPKSCHISIILRSLQWLKITENIEYKLLSLTYKVLTITQPPYLYNLMSVQRPRSTRCSPVVCYCCSSTNIILPKNKRSLISLCSSGLWNKLYLFVCLVLVPVPLLPLLFHLSAHP